MNESSIPVLPCLCSSFRRSARALTQRYDEALRPRGLRSTQFTILQVLSYVGEVPQKRLAEVLAMDSTTLTRNLQPMLRRRWIAERPGDDRRERLLSLAAAGEAKFRQALSAWQAVQDSLRLRLGDAPWKQLLQLTHQVTGLVREQGESS